MSILVILAFLFSCREHYMQICDTDFDYRHLMASHQVLEGYQFWASKSRDAIECATMCLRRKLCFSFNFDTKAGVCELNVNSSGAVQRRAGVYFSEISSWPSQIDPDCYNRPCEEDEVCIPSNLGTGTSCSYTCIKLCKPSMPLPTGTKLGHTRTVGSSFNFTCDHGYVGGDTAVCLPTGQWNKTIDTTCTPVYGSECLDDDDCMAINGICSAESGCTCPSTHVYNVSDVKCLKDCAEPWLLFDDTCYFFGNASLSSNFTQAEFFCMNQNASLVEVNTVEELNFLKAEIATRNHIVMSFWMDLYQFGDEDGTERWKTSNNSLDPQVADWHDGEPNFANERCTVFHGNYQNQFVDELCEDPSYMPSPICEKQ